MLRSCLDVQDLIPRAPSWSLVDLLHDGRVAIPLDPEVCALFGLQSLHLKVLGHEHEDLAQRLRQHSSIVSAQAGVMQLRSHMLATAAAERAHALSDWASSTL